MESWCFHAWQHPIYLLFLYFLLNVLMLVCRGSAFPKEYIAMEERCLVDEDMCIAVCGDFCLGPNVECAILSFLAASKKIQSLLASNAKLWHAVNFFLEALYQRLRNEVNHVFESQLWSLYIYALNKQYIEWVLSAYFIHKFCIGNAGKVKVRNTSEKENQLWIQ